MEVAMDERSPSSQVARPYQLQLLAAAKERNVIAYLETGAGKTLIAAMLIRDQLKVASAPREGKTAAFIVDRVSLATQQAEYLRRYLGETHPVGVYCGGKNVASWSRSRWCGELRGKRVLLFTAQILLNALRRVNLLVTDFELLVFDEAHHATRSHPFALIMEKFYWPAVTAQVEVPRVFGMSASPVKVKKGSTLKLCKSSIESLQRVLNAEVIAVSEDHQVYVDTSVAKAKELVVEYDNLKLTADGGLGSPGRRVPIFGREVADQLGRYALDILESGAKDVDVPEDTNGQISSKVECLFQILASVRSGWCEAGEDDASFRCLIFVERRVIAVVLARLLCLLLKSNGGEGLEARAVLGANSGKNCDGLGAVRMTQGEMLAAVADYRSGAVNILVSTNVLEEGLDVPECSLVVMFDGVSVARSYIQSRGRARHRRSKYVILQPKHGREAMVARENVAKARAGAVAMKKTARKLSSGVRVTHWSGRRR